MQIRKDYKLVVLSIVSILFLFATVNIRAEGQRVELRLEGSSSVSEKLVDVPRDSRYSIRVDYYYDAHNLASRADLWRAVGGLHMEAPGKAVESGAPFDVQVQLIEESSGRQVYKATKKNPKLSSWGEGVLHAEVADLFLKSGRYRLIVRRDGSAESIRPNSATVTFIKAFYGK
ncbi:hypothetical protein [Pseudomonas brassicacearum]|uniref:hypothetical protein n=1 Tax=Pseudomonas brassicacearum TaxID=930166 RepID=UPI0011875E68|nr:hypothetical protein [Pseudomonas brassicacearum]